MALKFAKTYEMAGSSPPPMPWEEYSQVVQQEWLELLNSSRAKVEANIQHFLEAHPCMVPGGQSMSGPSGHSAYPCALITQPRLPGFQAKVPDFLWLSADSLNLYAVLVEIEAPTKPMFTRAKNPTAEFTQAQTQLATWKAWLSVPSNETAFRQAYMQSFDIPWRRFVPQFVLIYGRRAELEARPELNATRAHMQRESEFYMTFDRLHPIKDQDNYMTARFDGVRYQAVAMPATLELRPSDAEYRAAIFGKEDVVDRTPFMTSDRKEFLKRRFSYWDEWARQGEKGVQSMGDRE